MCVCVYIYVNICKGPTLISLTGLLLHLNPTHDGGREAVFIVAKSGYGRSMAAVLKQAALIILFWHREQLITSDYACQP